MYIKLLYVFNAHLFTNINMFIKILHAQKLEYIHRACKKLTDKFLNNYDRMSELQT
jgi:hypothetical protein